MRTAPTTMKHTLSILDDLSEQNRSEHITLGLDRNGVERMVETYLSTGEATTGFADGKPVVVFGVIPSPVIGMNTTWFLASKAYWSLGLSAIRFARRFLAERADKYCPMVTVTCSPHKDVDRWFKALGYKKIKESRGFRWFKYCPKAPISPKNPALSSESRDSEPAQQGLI